MSKGLHFLSLNDFSNSDITGLIEDAVMFKREKSWGRDLLTGRTIGLIFKKPSTRTRVSFEVAVNQMGGNALNLSPQELQLSRGEPIKDTARVLSRYLDALVIRTFEQAEIEEYAKFSTIPIINALTNEYHPCQILADILTIVEYKSALRGLKVAYLGDSNNVSNTIMIGMSKLGAKVFIGCPRDHEPSEKIMIYSQQAAKEGKGSVVVTNDSQEAARSADVLYADVWVSMGQDASQKELKEFLPYQINSKLLSFAKPDAVVMHCLPAHRGEEITDEIIEGKNSVVFDQAENRLHAQKAILNYLLSPRS